MSKKCTKLGSSFNCCPLGNADWSVLMLIFGYDPFWAYYDLFTTAFGSLKKYW